MYKNVISKVLRPGDKGYKKLDQPPASPIERSTPPAATASRTNGAPAVAPTAIAKPDSPASQSKEQGEKAMRAQ